MPCPFCGSSDGVELSRAPTTQFYVWCVNCGMTGPPTEGKEGADVERPIAVLAWNRRVTPSVPSTDDSAPSPGPGQAASR